MLRKVAWMVVAALVWALVCAGSIACPYALLLASPYLVGLAGGNTLASVLISLPIGVAIFLSLHLGGAVGYYLSNGRWWLYTTIYAATATAMLLAALALYGEGALVGLAPFYAVIAGAQAGFAYACSKLL